MATWSVRAIAALLACPLVFAPFRAEAQSATALDRLTPAPAGDALLSLPTADVTGDLRTAGAIALSYAHQPLAVRAGSPDGATLDWVSRQLLLHALVGVELVRQVKLELDVPFTLEQGGESGRLGPVAVAGPSGSAAGDLRAGVRAALLHQKGFIPAAALAFSAWVPSGDSTAFAGAGTLRFAPAVVIGADYDRWLWTATAGGRFQDASVASVTGSEVFWGAGGGVRHGPLQLAAELSFWAAATEAPASPLATRRAIGGELLATARYALGPFTLSAGGGPGLGRLPGTPRFRVLAAVEVAAELGPLARRARGAATPAGDADAGARSPASRPPPAAPDLDGDTVPDADDACPNLVGPASPSAPPSGQAQPRFRRGCPPDRDDDAIYDVDDSCPDAPGVLSAVPEKNGCPSDADGDGIPDTEDACPNESGKPSQDRATHGCPAAVRVEGTQIVILQQVQFATGRAEIERESYELLGEVASVLQEHPEIARVAVDGHTDSVGAQARNLDLSQRRALAVVQWLTAHGVDARRLEARGFGPRRPLADNGTAEGRAKNRRVEFQIRKRTDQGVLGWRDGPID